MTLAHLVARYLAQTDGPRVEPSALTPPSPSSIETEASGRLHGAGPSSDLPPLISDWPAEWRQVFEERAAIMEFEGHLARADAESGAAHWARHLYRNDGEGRLDGDRGGGKADGADA